MCRVRFVDRFISEREKSLYPGISRTSSKVKPIGKEVFVISITYFTTPVSLCQDTCEINCEQGSAHGIHFRQRYTQYREECLRLGGMRYDEIGTFLYDRWNPFRLPGASGD